MSVSGVLLPGWIENLQPHEPLWNSFDNSSLGNKEYFTKHKLLNTEEVYVIHSTCVIALDKHYCYLVLQVIVKTLPDISKVYLVGLIVGLIGSSNMSLLVT